MTPREAREYIEGILEDHHRGDIEVTRVSITVHGDRNDPGLTIEAWAHAGDSRPAAHCACCVGVGQERAACRIAASHLEKAHDRNEGSQSKCQPDSKTDQARTSRS